MSRTRGATLLATAMLAALSLSACADESAPEAEPADVSSGGASPTETASSEEPTESPSAEAKPLSRFEEDPAVQSARSWAVAAARAINADRRDLGEAQQWMTASGQQSIPQAAADEFGLRYPGPVPFTPTDVSHRGPRATVSVCFWSGGFGLNKATGQPRDARNIVPLQFAMVRQGGTWKLDAFVASEADCSKVPVKGVGF